MIDGAQNCVDDIFSASDDEFAAIFPEGTDIAFIDEVDAKGDTQVLDQACVGFTTGTMTYRQTTTAFA